jgi:tellurite resistance protein TerC
VFAAVVTVALSLDLLVFRRDPREMSVARSLAWMVVWVALAAAFNLAVWYWFGPARALEFSTAYVVEEALSVDNMFVFFVIFSYFAVPRAHQHRVLFWGIVGALILRGVFVAVGAAMLARFEWLIYVFGAFLVYTGFRLFFHDGESLEPETNPVVKLFRRFVPLSEKFVGHLFTVREHGKLLATPLLLVLVLVEATDVAFATDSIPAVFAISRNTFIIYSSNVFAVLGLRSLYFVMAGMIGGFRYLNYGLAIVLAFIGIKMLLAAHYPISTGVSLGVVGGVIATSIAASMWKKI